MYCRFVRVPKRVFHFVTLPLNFGKVSFGNFKVEIKVEICKPKAKPFLINTWYRSPNTSLELFNSYEELVENMDSEGNEIILIRDFNCEWSLQKDKLNPQTNKLVDLANLFQLEQFIKLPTRITQTTRTIIDLAFSNRLEIVLASGVEH